MSEKLTKAQWDALGKEINLHNSIYLLIDGIPFAIGEYRNKQKIQVNFYICSWFYGVWHKDHFFTKYFREVRKAALTKIEREKWYQLEKKLHGKKKADEWIQKQYFTYRIPTFPSLKTFESHINKVAKSISVLEYSEYRTLSESYRKAHPEYFRNETEEASK